MSNNLVSKNNKSKKLNNKKKGNKKKGTKKNTPILDILGPKKKCNYLDLDCLFNVKKTKPTESDLFYENMGQLIDVDADFGEKYYTKCKNMQTYNNSNNRFTKIDEMIKSKKKKKSKKKGGWEIITLPKSLYTKKLKKKTCFKKEEDYPLNLDLGEECYKDFQCKSSKCNSFSLFGLSTGGKCVEPIDMRSKKEGDTCKEDKECKQHLVCKGSEDIDEKICILNKKYIEEIDEPSKFNDIDRSKMSENMRWTHITPNFEQGASIKFCKKDKDCEKGHCVSTEVTPYDITKQHYTDDLRKKIFGEHVDKDINKSKKRNINICHNIGIKCDSSLNETCRSLGSTRSKEFRDNKCCGRNQMCENNLCIPLENAQNIPLNFSCIKSSQCKSKFCDPTSKLCKPRNPNYTQCRRHIDCDSESRACYDGSCIEIEELPNNSVKGGDKCARSSQCMGTSRCRGYKPSKFIKQKNILGDTYGSKTHYYLCEQTPEQYKEEQKQKEREEKSNKNIMSAFVELINKIYNNSKTSNYAPKIIYSYHSSDIDEYKTVIVFENNNYYLGKMTIDKDSNTGKDNMTIYYFSDQKVNNIKLCKVKRNNKEEKLEMRKVKPCPNYLLSNLKIMTNNNNYFLKNGLMYQLYDSTSEELKTIILEDIKTEKFSSKFNNFDGIIKYNGVTYNENKKIYEKNKYRNENTYQPSVLNIPNQFLYNLLVYMLFFDKFELTENFINSHDKYFNKKTGSDIKCEAKKDNESNEIDTIENINEVCEHSYGYIHHLPKKTFEEDNYDIIKKKKLCRYKLCGYELSDKKKNTNACDENFDHNKMQLLDIPYTLNYKCMFKINRNNDVFDPKFLSMKEFGNNRNSSSNISKSKHFINIFNAWLEIVTTKKYTELEDIYHNNIFGELNQSIMNYNFKTMNVEKVNFIKQKFENQTYYRKNILNAVKNLEHIVKINSDKNNLNKNINFNDSKFNRYSVLSELIN